MRPLYMKRCYKFTRKIKRCCFAGTTQSASRKSQEVITNCISTIPIAYCYHLQSCSVFGKHADNAGNAAANAALEQLETFGRGRSTAAAPESLRAKTAL